MQDSLYSPHSSETCEAVFPSREPFVENGHIKEGSWHGNEYIVSGK